MGYSLLALWLLAGCGRIHGGQAPGEGDPAGGAVEEGADPASSGGPDHNGVRSARYAPSASLLLAPLTVAPGLEGGVAPLPLHFPATHALEGFQTVAWGEVAPVDDEDALRMAADGGHAVLVYGRWVPAGGASDGETGRQSPPLLEVRVAMPQHLHWANLNPSSWDDSPQPVVEAGLWRPETLVLGPLRLRDLRCVNDVLLLVAASEVERRAARERSAEGGEARPSFISRMASDAMGMMANGQASAGLDGSGFDLLAARILLPTDAEQAEAHLQRFETRCRQDPVACRQAALLARGDLAWGRGDAAGALAAYQALVATLGPGSPPSLKARYHLRVSLALRPPGRSWEPPSGEHAALYVDSLRQAADALEGHPYTAWEAGIRHQLAWAVGEGPERYQQNVRALALVRALPPEDFDPEWARALCLGVIRDGLQQGDPTAVAQCLAPMFEDTWERSGMDSVLPGRWDSALSFDTDLHGQPYWGFLGPFSWALRDVEVTLLSTPGRTIDARALEALIPRVAAELSPPHAVDPALLKLALAYHVDTPDPALAQVLVWEALASPLPPRGRAAAAALLLEPFLLGKEPPAGLLATWERLGADVQAMVDPVTRAGVAEIWAAAGDWARFDAVVAGGVVARPLTSPLLERVEQLSAAGHFAEAQALLAPTLRAVRLGRFDPPSGHERGLIHDEVRLLQAASWLALAQGDVNDALMWVGLNLHRNGPGLAAGDDPEEIWLAGLLDQLGQVQVAAGLGPHAEWAFKEALRHVGAAEDPAWEAGLRGRLAEATAR